MAIAPVSDGAGASSNSASDTITWSHTISGDTINVTLTLTAAAA